MAHSFTPAWGGQCPPPLPALSRAPGRAAASPIHGVSEGSSVCSRPGCRSPWCKWCLSGSQALHSGKVARLWAAWCQRSRGFCAQEAGGQVRPHPHLARCCATTSRALATARLRSVSSTFRGRLLYVAGVGPIIEGIKPSKEPRG